MPIQSPGNAQPLSSPGIPSWRRVLRGEGGWTPIIAWVFWTTLFILAVFIFSRDFQRTHVRHSVGVTLALSAEAVLFIIWQGVVAWKLTARYFIGRARALRSLGAHFLGALAVLISGRALGILHDVTNAYVSRKPQWTLTRVARRTGSQLEVAMCDDGAGVKAPRGAIGPQVGLANTRSRLRELYGEGASFELSPRAGGGTVARLLMPWHEEPIAPGTASYGVSLREQAMMPA